MTGFLQRWGPALAWAALLFAVSSRPSLPVDLHSGSDKLAHFAAYAVLGVLLARGQRLAGISVIWAVLVGILVGGLDELFQSTVPNRQADVADWIADSLGVAFGVLVFHAWCRARSGGRSPANRSDPLPNE